MRIARPAGRGRPALHRQAWIEGSSNLEGRVFFLKAFLPTDGGATLLHSEPEVARGATGRRNVALGRVIHHHAIGVEAPAEGADGALHALDPAARKAVAIALIVERDHFVTKNPYQVFPIAGVVNIHVGVRSAASDGEAVQTVVSFRPPAVQNR